MIELNALPKLNIKEASSYKPLASAIY